MFKGIKKAFKENKHTILSEIIGSFPLGFSLVEAAKSWDLHDNAPIIGAGVFAATSILYKTKALEEDMHDILEAPLKSFKKNKRFLGNLIGGFSAGFGLDFVMNEDAMNAFMTGSAVGIAYVLHKLMPGEPPKPRQPKNGPSQ